MKRIEVIRMNYFGEWEAIDLSRLTKYDEDAWYKAWCITVDGKLLKTPTGRVKKFWTLAQAEDNVKKIIRAEFKNSSEKQ